MPWFGPPMSPTSMATARLMETWAHGLDVHEALGVTPEPTNRIRHIAHLAVRTRDFAFATTRRRRPPRSSGSTSSRRTATCGRSGPRTPSRR